MSDQIKFVQNQASTLAGAGVLIGDTEVTLAAFAGIDGDLLTMTDFGTKGFCTLEPNSGMQEEQISFTGVTQNSNGTATLTGVSNVLFIAPYTEVSGFAKSHAGGVKLVISNTAGFYNTFADKNDDETITGTWTFTAPNYPRMDLVVVFPTDPEQLTPKAYVDSLVIAGAPNASTSVQGLVQEATVAELNAGTGTGSTGALLFGSPADFAASIYGLQLPNANQKDALVSTQAPTASNVYITQKDQQRNVTIYAADSVGTDAYAITVTPAVTSYTAGMVFYFKAGTANTGAATLAVGSGAAKAIVKRANTALVTGDILQNQVVQVSYNSTNDNWQMMSPSALDVLPALGTSVLSATVSSGTITTLDATATVPTGTHYGIVNAILSTTNNNGTANVNTFQYTLTTVTVGTTTASTAQNNGVTTDNGTVSCAISGNTLTVTMTGPSIATNTHSYTITGNVFWY